MALLWRFPHAQVRVASAARAPARGPVRQTRGRGGLRATPKINVVVVIVAVENANVAEVEAPNVWASSDAKG